MLKYRERYKRFGKPLLIFSKDGIRLIWDGQTFKIIAPNIQPFEPRQFEDLYEIFNLSTKDEREWLDYVVRHRVGAEKIFLGLKEKSKKIYEKIRKKIDEKTFKILYNKYIDEKPYISSIYRCYIKINNNIYNIICYYYVLLLIYDDIQHGITHTHA